MYKNWLVLIVVLFFVSCQSGKEFRHLTVVSYNVENLFDTIDDPHTRDNEFLPEGDKKWTSERYEKKLNDIARVLTAINPDDLPEIIGLTEVENRQVLDDLVNTDAMVPGDYQIVHQDSPDKRGIDVALLYRPVEFNFISFEAIPVDPGFATRDILHVHGTFKKEDFHFFVNHWPSRIGGLEKSEPNRLVVAETLKAKVDEVLADDPDAHIVIIGDMNDEPQNKSLKEVLGAGIPDSDLALVNLMMPLALEKKGTYNYRGNWNMLDNLVVSSNLLDKKGFQVSPATGYIFREAWMEYTNKEQEVSPNRTYGGPNYYGGVSDHFPVYFEMKK
ncbi:endonuclease/exonuclease/phosphatase family protein [Mangrovibacterium lignilyticum]|uniref:endonuclease/exonuclease/phosphatase family protein n=1 Tax=Mangrovibacterium lignilyticum TaxID=2668052 RepID=UPI0013D18D1C|nr:endonuclease/exonuclease/phosphatase family protein [Mangrovibacterium lignilyticum]